MTNMKEDIVTNIGLAVYIDRGTGTRTRGAERPEVLVT